jgi:methionyl aminopeptidase
LFRFDLSHVFITFAENSQVRMGNIIIKTYEQTEGIRQSCKLAARTLEYISGYVEAGVTTAYLDGLIEEFIRKNGAIPAPKGYNGFPKASCISPNEIVCHGIPSDKTILKDGDIINIDVTTILNGYYGDTSKMFLIGEVPDKARKLVETTKHCLNLGIQQVKPGNYFGNIGFVINRYARANGFSVVFEFCGHGTGLHFHEEPQVDHTARRNTGALMKPGMIFTIEPMINEGRATTRIDKTDGWTARTSDNRLSAQYEHTVLVTQTGFEVLTDIDDEYPVT